ncbi:hypothetical protein DL764_002212 [Monosporascus ibericus]|uniref:Uncharacterized protein n=1 Tax=Monosporascus ibericus TaxID=155417 RepID=A0A4Q4TLD8_9PEZI|nr:hypothetical protein DL764_002212 [Monosporascus ibericus]
MRTKRSLPAIQFLLCHIILGHIALVHGQGASGVSPASLRDVHENSDVSQPGNGEIMVKMASELHNKEKDVKFDAQDHEVDSDFTALREKRSPRRSGGGGSGGSSGGSSDNSTDENGSASVVAGSAGFVVSFATALSLCLAMGLLGF